MARRIQLVSDTESFDFTPQGFDTTFQLRRVPLSTIEQLRRQNTKRGELQEGAFTIAVLRYAVLGWAGMESTNGVEVPFDLKLVDKIPDEIAAEIVTELRQSKINDNLTSGEKKT